LTPLLKPADWLGEPHSLVKVANFVAVNYVNYTELFFEFIPSTNFFTSCKR